MKKIIYPALAIFLFIACSCTKTTEETKIELLNNFMPATTGSFWTYTDYPQGNVYSQSVTDIDSTFNGKKYRGMSNTKSGMSWYRKEGGSYYNLLINGNQQIEFLYLKEDVIKGSSWEVKFTANGFNNRYHYSIAEFDVAKIVYGNIFPHCINVQLAVYTDFGQGDSLVSNSFYTYANNVGLVYIERSYKDKTYLNNFKIK